MERVGPARIYWCMLTVSTPEPEDAFFFFLEVAPVFFLVGFWNDESMAWAGSSRHFSRASKGCF